MSAENPPDPSRSANELVAGYKSLSQEYKDLAQRSRAIERQLSRFKQQNEALRRLLPPNQDAPKLLEDVSEDGIHEISFSSRNVADCIMELRGADHAESQRSVAAIRLADFACFKILDRSGDANAGGRDLSRPPSRKKARISFPDLEEDHTVARKPGQLGCPFATRSKPLSNSVSRHDLPTPRSSGSHLSYHGSHNQRTSLNDPLRPRTEEASRISSTGSEQDADDGPACPIRFLDQHTPEDVAKYFEEHKHELPPSHEACVQRFQTNTESIKELDAKYGNLVTMIQGLGHKHQPMLPDAPNPSEVAIHEDSKSAQRVKRWAKAISEGQGVGQQHIQNDMETQSAHAEEERMSHFDRPLKEIRVGESPSRPWGVPIPSKYLDKAAQSDVSDSVRVENQDGPAEVARATVEVPKHTAPSRSAEVTPETAPPRAKGRCPLGHGPRANDLPGPLTSNPANKVDLQSSPKLRTAPEHDAPTPSHRHGSVVNHGLAVVADRSLLQSLDLENRGTMLLGYTAREAWEFADGQQAK